MTNAFIEHPYRFRGDERWAEHFWQWVRGVGLADIKKLTHVVIDCGEWKARYLDGRSGLPHKKDIHDLLSDISHFFRSVHPSLGIELTADVVYHFDLQAGDLPTIVNEAWKQHVNLTSFTMPMMSFDIAKNEMSRIVREERTQLQQALQGGTMDSELHSSLHTHLQRFRVTLGELLQTCFQDPNPRNIDPFGGAETILSELRAEKERKRAIVDKERRRALAKKIEQQGLMKKAERKEAAPHE